MSREWDDFSNGEHDTRQNFINFIQSVMVECIRVLKPGGHALVWALPRTSHWTATALENAGFEVRDEISNFYHSSDDAKNFIDSLDEQQKKLLAKSLSDETMVAHCFGTGFPKSFDISKALDKQAGAEREVIGASPSTDSAKQWSGWGTALKPAHEVWWLVRKPLSEKSVAENVLKNSTGGINIDACRVEANYSDSERRTSNSGTTDGVVNFGITKDRPPKFDGQRHNPQGRFPTNLILTHSEYCRCVGTKRVKSSNALKADGIRSSSPNDIYGGGFKPELSISPPTYNDFEGKETVESWECVEGCPVKLIDEQSGSCGGGNHKYHRPKPDGRAGEIYGAYEQHPSGREIGYGDKGGASRFFYCSKASKADRNSGCDDLEEKQYSSDGREVENDTAFQRNKSVAKNSHPTVKSLKLMEYFVKLVTPANGIVLDPFMGSGSTGCACMKNGFGFIGIEMEKEYFIIAEKRIAHAKKVINQYNKQMELAL